jgi:hypothetical protein
LTDVRSRDLKKAAVSASVIAGQARNDSLRVKPAMTVG